MNLAETIYLMVQKSMKAAQLADYRVGTVVAVDPLQVTINPNMAPLQESVLLLTSAVIEKKIPVLNHAHTVDGLAHTHSVTGLSHQHNTSGLGHTHAISGLGHTHSTDSGTTGSALESYYATDGALPGSYQSDTQLSGTYPTTNALGNAESSSALGSVACVENGVTLPVENGYIILNRGLEVGDEVLLLRVSGGQKFIILSRTFKGA